MVLLGLGSNLGDRLQNIKTAVALLPSSGKIRIEILSSVYETEPFGVKEQPSFLNAVLQISTDYSPVELLQYCQAIEQRLGRTRICHWGPRSIDIDILIFDEITVATEQLVLPHPYLAQRKFVLLPIQEISAVQLIAGQTAGELLQCCVDTGKVEFYQPATVLLG